ncbi:uncharacterized protein LOC131953968 isoform X2 [Physella acuta]|nr:uncharacterized protein LOC131953968 isoform X2 [Physella acuta]
MRCHYYFLLEHYTTMSSACYDCPLNKSHCGLPQCIPGDGTPRGVLTVNRMVPGPNIFVCQNDIIEVLVDNRMELGEGTSIHWHGIRQMGTPHMDGTNLITQCPIHRWATMKYRFQAVDTGTHFWHSHSSMQRSEGLFGGLVIREPKVLDLQGHLFDHDLPEHYILLSDWTEKMSGEAYAQDFHSGQTTDVNSILVNGMGKAKGQTNMPFPVFSVRAGEKYRFRIAYNGILNCPIYVKVDDHPMLMISTDGEDFEPLEVDAFMIFSGERYDFVLQAKADIKQTFWIRFKGHGRCLATRAFQAAILKYEGTEEVQPPEEATFNNTVESETERILNGRKGSTNTSYQIVDLNALPENNEDHLFQTLPDKQFFISIGASEILDERFLPPPQPVLSTVTPPPVRPFNHQMNYISFRLPPSPPLSQFDEIPKGLLCNNDTVKYECSKELCICVHMLKYDIGDMVELVLVSYKNTLIHPMHMHGHSYKVITMHRFGRDVTMNEVKALNEKGEIPRKTSRAPRKDTLAVPEQAVTIIRFRADNPGFWFFHCHIEFHAELGMALILQEGNANQMPPPPEGFPTCHSWRPTDKTLSSKQKLGAQFNNTAQMLSSDSAFSQSLVIAVSCITVVCVGLLLIITFERHQRNKVSYQALHMKEMESYQSIQ